MATVEALLRELEAQLARKTAEARARIALAVHQMKDGYKVLAAELEFKPLTIVMALGSISIAAAGGALSTLAKDARQLAAKIGPHVTALF
jgi:hypothetical protein